VERKSDGRPGDESAMKLVSEVDRKMEGSKDTD